MASKAYVDRYAAELVQRFDDFTKWAIANWPHKNFPLTRSDFAESSKEIAKILGPKLDEGETDSSADTAMENLRRYIDTNPTPWP